MSLALALTHAGVPVSVINPAHAHHVAKALLKRAKTDAIDAHTLAQLAALLHPVPWTPPPAVYTELDQRLSQRDACIAMRQQVRNQLHALRQAPHVVPAVQARMAQLMVMLDAQIDEREADIAAALNGDAAWAAAAARLQTLPGVGPLTAAWLLVTTLNFTIAQTPEELTAYAGLAPNPRQSGTSVQARGRSGHVGNARLRTTLSVATLSAAQYNPVIKACYTRLRMAGNPPNVARCAAARKLLHIAWAVATKEHEFDPHHAPARNNPAPQLARA